MKLIHWGARAFEPDKFVPIMHRNCLAAAKKPLGGLWASPIGSKWGWRDWCKAAGFQEYDDDNYFTFTLSGRILTIDCHDDLDKMYFFSYMPGKGVDFLQCPDFERLATEYDAVYLTENGEQSTRQTDINLYGWDCECVLVLNKDAINEE